MNCSSEPGPAKPALARPERPSAVARSCRRRARFRTTSRPSRGRYSPRRRERLVAAQDGVHFARQHDHVPRPSRRPVRPHPYLPLPLPPPPPSNKPLFTTDPASRTMRWTYRARRRSRPSRIRLLPREAQSSSARCAIRPNRVCAPSRSTRYSRTRTCGRTRTTCSGSANGQASAGPRCAFAVVSLPPT